MTFLLWAWRLEKLLLNVNSHNHYFQLKRLWLFLFAVFLADNRPIFLTSVCHYDMRLARVNHQLLLIYIYIYISVRRFAHRALWFWINWGMLLGRFEFWIFVTFLSILGRVTLWILFVRHLTKPVFTHIYLLSAIFGWSVDPFDDQK